MADEQGTTPPEGEEKPVGLELISPPDQFLKELEKSRGLRPQLTLPEHRKIIAEQWYRRGFRRAEELVTVMPLSIAEAKTVIEDIELRMAGRANKVMPEIEAQLAMERENEHYMKLWDALGRTQDPEIIAKIVKVMGEVNDRNMKIAGIVDAEKRANYFSNMLGALIYDLRALFESVQDPILLARLRQIITKHLAASPDALRAVGRVIDQETENK